MTRFSYISFTLALIVSYKGLFIIYGNEIKYDESSIFIGFFLGNTLLLIGLIFAGLTIMTNSEKKIELKDQKTTIIAGLLNIAGLLLWGSVFLI